MNIKRKLLSFFLAIITVITLLPALKQNSKRAAAIAARRRKKELNCMKIKKGRLFSAALCVAVLLSILPQKIFAAQTVIPEVRLVGMSEISIKKGVMAKPVKLTCPGSDEILKIDNGNWYRACDGAKLSSGIDPFDSGTEYY